MNSLASGLSVRWRTVRIPIGCHSASTGTGHLQKGHGVAFSDVNNNGSQDVLINLGGAALGDKYNKALFANPGQGNNWLSIKLVGVKTNRAAIGANKSISRVTR